MKHHQKIAQFFLALILAFTFLSCQEEQIVSNPEIQDQDLETAIALADDYLETHTAGKDHIPSIAVTSLHYENGRIEYLTDWYDEDGYLIVEEHTITAEVAPGGYIFWYGGRGLKSISGIEFDEEALEFLGGNPIEIYPGLLWGIQVPYLENEDDESNEPLYLKYDILYKYSGYTGSPIRLDPHIRVKEGAE